MINIICIRFIDTNITQTYFSDLNNINVEIGLTALIYIYIYIYDQVRLGYRAYVLTQRTQHLMLVLHYRA